MASFAPASRKDYCFTCTQGQKLLSVTAWEVQTGVTQCTYSCDGGSSSGVGPGVIGGAVALCLLGKSHLLCAPSNLPFIYVWSLNKEQVLLKIACPGLVRALDCSPDGVFCAGAIAEKIYIWHICTGNLLTVVSQHYQPINVLKFSDDRVHLISGGDDSRVIVWRFNSLLAESYVSCGNTLLQTPPSSSTPSLTRHIWSDHSLPVTDLYCGKGGLHCRVVTASLDQTCKVYEIASGNLLCSILFGCGLTCVTLDLAEQWLFSGASNGNIFQVNLFSKPLGPRISGEENKWIFSGHSKPISGLAVASWAHALVSTSSLEDTARVWDISSHQAIREVKLKGPINKMLLSGGLLELLSKQEALVHKPIIPIVKPFKKQLFDSRSSSDGSKNTESSSGIPIQLAGIDPLCKLSDLHELEAMYQPLSVHVSSPTDQDLTLQRVRQQLSELKDLNNELYTFIMDKLIPS